VAVTARWRGSCLGPPEGGRGRADGGGGERMSGWEQSRSEGAAVPRAAAVEGDAGGTGLRAALAVPAFRRLWLAELLAQTAQNAIWFAALIATERATHSTTLTGVTVASAALPVALFGMLAGVLVDRWERKGVLVWTSLVRVVLAVAYLGYGWSIDILFAANFAINVVAQFFSPALLATLPALLPRRLLTAATGLLNVTLNVAQLAGMVLLGPILSRVSGPESVFLAAAGLYLVAAALVVALPPDRADDAPGQRPVGGRGALAAVRADLAAGGAFVRADRPARRALAYLALTWTVLFALITLAPRYAASRQGLRIEAADAVFVLAPAGVGLALAAALLDRLVRRYGRWRLVGRSFVPLACCLAALAAVAPVANWWSRRGIATGAARMIMHQPLLVPRVLAVMAIALGIGWWVGLITVSAEAVLLERAPDALRGRVFALQLTCTNLAAVVPVLAVGALADRIGINAMIALAGAVVLLAWLLGDAPFAPSPLRDD
jgi:MFS family permease